MPGGQSANGALRITSAYILRLTPAVLLVAGASVFAASKTATISLDAEVLPACTAGSTTDAQRVFGTFDLGTHFALSNTVVVGSQPNAGALRINCISGTSYRILISAGSSGASSQRTLVGPGGATIRYNLYTGPDFTTVWDELTGVSRTGSGQDQWIPPYVRIPAQPTPIAGVYADTLTVTVSW
jgi:spore coat protein U-like protein